MALQLGLPARSRDPRGLDDALRTRLAAAAGDTTARRRLGVEHEYAVFEGPRQVDFRDHVHRLGIEARALHPVNAHMLLTSSGLAVMADGVVAETASPPATLRRGFGRAIEAWGASGRSVLEAALPASMRLVPGSTHISVETHPSRTDQLCLWFAQTFAPALMLLTDNIDSPGALVRPRPGRFEFGGEYVDGTRLRAAMTFAAGAVLALEQARRLPPAVQVTIEPARQRYGWYIDRTAFGPDLYREGREAMLRTTAGQVISAQAHLEACWAIARDALDDLADAGDIEAVERMIRGDIPLPCEQTTWTEPSVPGAPPPSPYGALSQTRNSLGIEPVGATWDFVAFRVARAASGVHPASAVIVNVPEAQVDAFTALVAAGALDDLFAGALDTAGLPVLEVHAQTLQAGFFAAVVPGDALLPRDRVGVGSGPVSTFRPGKIETPPPPPPPHTDPIRTGGVPWAWIAAVIGCIGLIGGVLIALRSGDPTKVNATPTPAASVSATSGAAVQAPVVGAIRAVLAAPVTTYTVEASSPAGRPLTYRWTLAAQPGQDCGTKNPPTNAPTSSPVATWSHDNAPPDNCRHAAPDHPFFITVEVSDGVNPPVERTYRGSETGTGPVP